jgi:hypothetical protein
VVKHLSTRGQEYADYPDDDHLDDVDDDWADHIPPAERRWRPMGMIAGGVLLVAAVATAVILHSDDSASRGATVGPPARGVVATPAPPTPGPRPSPPAASSPPPETVTTVPPSTVAPRQPPAAPSPTPAAPQAAVPQPVNPRTVVYTVTGTRKLLDLVNVVYTDAQGAPHTDVNVPLPWRKTVVLNPGVDSVSVTATSLFGQLNCSILNANGQLAAVSAKNSIIAACRR